MKKIIFAGIAALSLISCSHDDKFIPSPKPVGSNDMIITDLQDQEFRFSNSLLLDLDKDGTNDVAFSTWWIGDPLEGEDEELFFAFSYEHSSLFVDGNNGSPRFTNNDIIPIKNSIGYEWYPVSHVDLIEKNTGYGGAPYWNGAWKIATHKFLGVQVVKNALKYNGWVEISVDTKSEKIIFHRAAISRIAGRDIKI